MKERCQVGRERGKSKTSSDKKSERERGEGWQQSQETSPRGLMAQIEEGREGEKPVSRSRRTHTSAKKKGGKGGDFEVKSLLSSDPLSSIVGGFA